MAQRFNAGTLKTEGDAVPIAEQVDSNVFAGGGLFSASHTGVLTYMSGSSGAAVRLTWFDRTGRAAGTVGDPGEIQWAQISPDGNAVAFDRRDPQTGLVDIWTHDLLHDTESRFTFGPSANQYPVWSADGSHIAFNSSRDGHGNIYQRATGGAAQDEALDKDERNKRPDDISSDGRFLVEETTTPGDIWVLPLSGDRKPYAYVHTEFSEGTAKLSPDGHWLAYRSDASKRNEIYVVTFPNLGGQWQISTGGGTRPIWSRDGKELYFISADQKLMTVEIRGGAKFERGTPKPLFDVKIAPGGGYDVSKDGPFLIPTQLEQAATVPLTVVANWQATLTRK